MPEETDYKIERLDCGHMAIIKAKPSQSIADYNTRLVPELREKLNSIPCEECEKQRAKLAKQKLEQEMKERAGKK